MKKLLALMLAAAMVFTLAACGGDPNVGEYEGVQIDIGIGEIMDMDEVFAGDNYIVLEEGGKGTFALEGDEADITWEVDDNDITIEVEGEEGECNGTLEDGVLTIDDFFGEEDLIMVFAKEDAEVPEMKPAGSSSGLSGALGGLGEDAGDGTEEAVAMEGGPAENEAAAQVGASASGFTPQTFTLGEYDVTVVGAESIVDTEGKDGIRVYYDFTNNSTELDSAWVSVSFYLEQEGYELGTTYVSYEDDAPEYGNDSLSIQPGTTIRCVTEYNCKVDGGPITVRIENTWSEVEAVGEMTFDPQALPGRPAQELEIPPITNPTFVADLPDSGPYRDSYEAAILNVEVIENGTAIRVYFDFTNNGEEAISPWAGAMIYVFQDGVPLDTYYPSETVAEDDAMSVQLEPGQTSTVSQCFELRNSNPIEVLLEDSWYGNQLGAIYTFE